MVLAAEDIQARAKKIKVLILDVDGVMTDGGLMLGDDGLEYKTFHSHDGLGMKMLRKTGVRMAIVTGRSSQVVVKRAENTGIDHYYQGVDDKLAAFNALLKDMDVTAEECVFMGDDVIDIPPIRRSGLGVTVPHAMPLVKEYAHYITTREAGRGAIREVCELIMQAQGTYQAQLAQYLE